MSKLITYCFDIDGTICSTNCEYEDAKPYKEVIKKINSLYNSGNSVILYPSRGSGSGIDWHDYTADQLDSWGLKHHKLRTGTKFHAIKFKGYSVEKNAILDIKSQRFLGVVTPIYITRNRPK